MRALLKSTLLLLLLTFTSVNWADTNLSSWFSKGPNNQIKLRVDLFLSSTCPHCQKADAFFSTLETQKPWLDVHRYLINQDKAALEMFHQELKQVKIDDYAVPAIFFCSSRWVGFDEANTTGQNLLRGLDYCYQEISKTGSLTPQTAHVLHQLSNASWFDASMTSQPSLLLFTLTMAMTDAFGPCSLFIILALFSFLWLYKERGVMIGLAVLFLLSVMVVHHFQQDHTIFFYQVLSVFQIPAELIGLGLIIYVLVIYFKGIRVRPGFTIPVLVVLTASAVQAYQQNCTPNFGLIYQQWLDGQGLTTIQGELIEIGYQLLYILPLALLAFLLIYFRNHERLKKFERILTYFSWYSLFIIGILLIIFPHGFSYFIVSIATIALALLAGWLTIKKLTRFRQ
ncbi:hypothetical protein [Legionella maceachernii]|uniref:Thioredoxin domain-containing protein n=1 Tax=Legionella maceachernii TaxID=466 RepID=A0A0W0WCV4_9GAMM|nr:hypothetical protein [Legionella maceachernii]KTD30187.1 hypothetical protein Lmac_0684 [Legionella maceachernii]SJZ92697.1 hypothetical protein SAMN02745128_01467 [Legionella maceachernii]SUP03507.1 Uncharacterised protein [Legionella maceachernii]